MHCPSLVVIARGMPEIFSFSYQGVDEFCATRFTVLGNLRGESALWWCWRNGVTEHCLRTSQDKLDARK
jgi:hypothetical protein